MLRSLAGLRLQTTGWLGLGDLGLNDRLLQGLLRNHVSQDRHRIDRQTDKPRRSIALAEWQSLMA
jgi:hypothetical protein